MNEKERKRTNKREMLEKDKNAATQGKAKMVMRRKGWCCPQRANNSDREGGGTRSRIDPFTQTCAVSNHC